MKGVLNKKLISIVGGILAFTLLCCFVMIGINLPRKENNNKVSAWSGSGTEDSPYLIKTRGDLNVLSTYIAGGDSYFGKHFRLECDIDYSDVENFRPIGATMSETTMTNVNSFCGVFDGNGHVISNLSTTVTNSNQSIALGHPWGVSIGFFAALGVFETSDSYNETTNTVATVKNLKIKNYTIKSTQSTCINMIGGIAGQVRTLADAGNEQNYSAKIEQCVVDGLNVTTTNAASYVSGLVGFQRAEGSSDLWWNCDTEETRALFIRNCMVLNFTNSAGNSNSLVASISPALGFTSSRDRTPTLLLESNEYRFYYHIEFCVTDNDSMTTIMEALEYMNDEGNYCNLNSGGIVGNWYRSSYSDGIYNYGAGLYSGAYINQIHSTDSIVSTGFKNVSYADQDVWTINSTSGVVYLTQFLTTATVSANPSSYGTVKENANKTGNFYIPKGDIPFKDNNKISFFKLYGSYLYNFTATPNSGYEFNNWLVDDSKSTIEIKANFNAGKVVITFMAVNGTTKTGNASYDIAPGSIVSISRDRGGYKTGAYKTISFKFTPYGGSSEVTVTYTINDDLKYISNAKVENSTNSSSSYTVNSATTFSVELANKTYNTLFN